MGNSENAKLKTLILYDYFRKHVNAFDENKPGVKLSEITDYLIAVTGDKFERKSVYSDIKKLNEFMAATGEVKGNGDWIYREGNYYCRSELKNELTQEEAQLIYDAIRTTPFVSSNICEKIEKLYPAYFKNYKPLLPQNSAISNQLKFILSTLRKSISEQTVVKIKYAHKYQNGYKGAYEDYISPVALDWEENCYYLIAINNKAYGTNKKVQNSIRKYRLDRIVSVEDANDYKYIPCDNKLLTSYLEHTVEAFSCWDYWDVRVDMDFSGVTALMRAFSACRDKIEIGSIINDLGIDKGKLSFYVKIPLIEDHDGNLKPAPTIYPILLMLYNLPYRNSIKIHNDVINNGFKEYLESALNGLN